MKAIGGYFEVEFSNISFGIHESAIKLNTARNCLEYILLANGYRKIYLPYYTCDVLTEPMKGMGVEIEFYGINEELEPIDIPVLRQDEAFLYINYFGIKGQFVRKLSTELKNLIIDNSQALFEQPTENATFYSLRKFVGIADGAFLYTDRLLKRELPIAMSFPRATHLYKRKDGNAELGFDDFQKSESSLSGLPIMQMSHSTSAFVRTYDFEKNRVIRDRNFLYLHHKLGELNRLRFSLDTLIGPCCYPLMWTNDSLKKLLLNNRVFIPTYWPKVTENLKSDSSVEARLVNSLVCIPVDHRYTLTDLAGIVEIIHDHDG